ncbi:MAG TPA: DNA replication and repair protein RecF [Pyrinomonadaceae bacterium]|nr:DNA replication and repair protein RecF [Pyrinomonadaceae bacterium]
MFLRSIEAHGFRNLEGEIVWGNGLNVLHGNNGEGKSNWLEAIYLLAHAKSFRTRQLNEIIRFGAGEASVRGTVARGNAIERELQVDIQARSKKTSVNGKREPLARYGAQLHAVCFTADELEVIRGGPEARRGFVDRGAVSLHPGYAQTLADYNKVTKQKRLLLQQASEGRSSREYLAELIEPWNKQLVRLGTQIHNVRTLHVNELNNALDHNLFSDNISIRYISSLEGKGDLSDYEALIATRLETRIQAEMFAGACLIGPHRDDLNVLFGGRDLRSFGSSGQQRSALITLDLAALSVYHSKHQDYPVFLIDDVDAELDGRRIDRLLEHLEGRTQTFITTSKRNHFERFYGRASFYEVTGGHASEDRGLSAVMATSAMSR